MFFPAETDALSPILELVTSYVPPKAPIKLVDFGQLSGAALTGMTGFPPMLIQTGWCSPDETDWLTLDVVR